MCVRVAFSIKGAWNMATLIQISYKIYIHQRVVPNEGGGRQKQHTHTHCRRGKKLDILHLVRHTDRTHERTGDGVV